MKPSVAKKHRKRFDFLGILTEQNPVLLLGVDLPFVVISATSLKNAVALSIEMFFIHLITLSLTFLLARNLKIWQRAIFATVISTITMVFAREFIISLFPDITNFVRFHLYLMAVNGMTLIQSIFLRKDTNFGKVAASGFVNASAFAVLMLISGMVREYLGNGTLWGKSLPILFKIKGVEAPFFGFMLLGFLLAIGRTLSRGFSAFRIRESARKEAARQTGDI